MENKQTAVEWLVKTLNNKIDYIPMKLWDDLREIIIKAKEMEKEQIMDAHNNGFSEGTVFGVNTIYKYKTSKEYYNETYEK